MKQLLHTCEPYIIAGFHDQAFLVYNSMTCKLLAPPCTVVASGTNEIQAVAVVCTPENDVWCAVSRYNKTLSLYCIHKQLEMTQIEPTIVHQMAKRSLCLAFASVVPSEHEAALLNIVIAGDLIGDATAFSLQHANTSKLLLGHTASMLTGVQVVGECILTCDRDEKIRISAFPQTCVVKGYLLGHTAYVASMDAASSREERCITCSGDCTVRLWDYVACKELANVKCKSLPTKVAMSPSGTMTAVIYDASDIMDILSGDTLKVVRRIDCPTQPLSIRFLSEERVLILCREPEYLIEYQLETKQLTTFQPLQALLVAENVTMPSTIMEIDERGQIKLQKLSETRGGEGKPWNKVERVQKAKEASSRRKKRKRVQTQGDASNQE